MDNVRSIAEASAAVKPCCPSPRVRQKLRIDWLLVASAWAKVCCLAGVSAATSRSWASVAFPTR